ncbi:MAG: helix-turn-helix transcriptional regulator [Bacillota bacterium]
MGIITNLVFDTSENMLDKKDLTTVLEEMDEALYIIHGELQYLSRYITSPHSFIFTGPRGYVLSVININTQMDIELGTSLDMSNIGYNAVDVAKETKSLSIVLGREQRSNLFRGYSCICTPIEVSNRNVGFLNLMLQQTEDLTFAIPMMKQLSKNIEGRLLKVCPTYQKENIFIMFNEYNMTPREKEIAYAWLRNLSCEEIASIYSISVHTVRTHVKHIYSKTNSFSKGEFFSKFKI